MEATVAPTAPTAGTTITATPAPVAAPASASVTPAERPTFAQAFASDAAPPSTTQAQPEAATTQPAESTTTEVPVHPSADKTGPIPFDVHKTALDNARTKAIAEYKEKVGWAENVDRSLIEETAKIGHLYRSDKPAFFRQLLAEAAGNPETLAVLRSESARFLAGGRQPAAAPVDLTPDIPVVDDQGRVVSHSFSAERVTQLLKQAGDSQASHVVSRPVAEVELGL
jgi:hypothetical protein